MSRPGFALFTSSLDFPLEAGATDDSHVQYILEVKGIS